LIEYIIEEPSGDEFKRGHKYPFVSCELLNCDVPKLLDFFTLTEAERLAKDRKTSSADSDLGTLDSNAYSQSENNSTKPDDKVKTEILEPKEEKEDKDSNVDQSDTKTVEAAFNKDENKNEEENKEGKYIYKKNSSCESTNRRRKQ
jgi:hypothetical protein